MTTLRPHSQPPCALETLESRRLLSAVDPLAGVGPQADTAAVAIEMEELAQQGTQVELLTPAAPTNVLRGETFRLQWAGGDFDRDLQIWLYGPDGWSLLADDVPVAQGFYDWSTVGAPQGWYTFGVWVEPAQVGDQWYFAYSPDWVRVTNPVNQAPSITMLEPDQDVEVFRGENVTVAWRTSDPELDSLHVSLWAYSLPTGWFQVQGAEWITAPSNGGTGTFTWNTDGLTPGWYSFATYVWDGSESAFDYADGWVHVVLPVGQMPSLTFITPDAGDSVFRGLDYEIVWDADVPAGTNMVLQLWGYGEEDGWFLIADNLDPNAGSYDWDTDDADDDWYSFGAWLGAGDVWVSAASDHVVDVIDIV